MKGLEKQAIDDALVSVGCRIGDDALMLGETSLPGVSAEAILTSVRSQFPTGYKKMSLNELMIAYKSYKAPPVLDDGLDILDYNTGVIRDRLGLIWNDSDACYHYAPVGGRKIGRIVPYDDLVDLVTRDCALWNKTHDREEGIYAPDILVNMRVMEINAKTDHFNSIDVKLEYNGNGSLDRWVRSLYDFWHITQDYDVFSTMFKHWMWCVKRRYSSESAVNEVMINIYGAQSAGKTIPITTLLDKVFGASLWSKIRIDTVTDERQHFLWSSKAVLMLDELQGDHVSGTALGAFKEMVTADRVNYRILGANKEDNGPKTACMIGTSNFHLFKRINDSSGMRRFIEFDIDPATPRIDQSEWMRKMHLITSGAVDAFKDIDIDSYGYWIPDSDNPALKETNKKIRGIQESYIDENPTIKWLKDTYIMDSTITKRNATIKVGNITTPGTVMFDYNNNWNAEHDRFDNSGKIKIGKSMIEKITEAFGPSAVFKDNAASTKLVRIEPIEPSGVIDPMRDIATPVNDTPFAEFE